MIMAKSADMLRAAYCASAGIHVRYVEVTDSARELERSHLCGPTASLIQAEALAGVALLGAELQLPDESISLRLKVDGPIQGVLVEARSDGGLRGYTQVKVMNDLDACEDLNASIALGNWAEVQVVRSIPGKILSSASVEISPALVTHAIEAYYRQSAQKQVWVQVSALAYGGFIDSARGVLFDCLPDGNSARFEQIGRWAADGTLQECLDAGASMATLCETVGLDACTLEPPRPLRFFCSCSVDRVEGMLQAMSSEDLEAMIREGAPARIFCHMCGQSYTVAVDRLQAILSARS